PDVHREVQGGDGVAGVGAGRRAAGGDGRAERESGGGKGGGKLDHEISPWTSYLPVTTPVRGRGCGLHPQWSLTVPRPVAIAAGTGANRRWLVREGGGRVRAWTTWNSPP